LLISSICAASSLQNAQRAQALLGPGTWSRIIRVENVAEKSLYPSVVFALVFELGSILWFYADTEGTQSFSLHQNNLAAEKADFSQLLRAIEPGFQRYSILEEMPAVENELIEQLPNGCLIESVASIQWLIDRGETIDRANLVSFYFELDGERKGHTVLAYENEAGAYLVDPTPRPRRIRVGKKLPDNPMVLAQKWQKHVPVQHARRFALSLHPSAGLAAAESSKSADTEKPKSSV
jgi:hypothetical protein